MKSILKFLLFLMTCQFANATDYYVDDNGSDNNNGTSPNTPYATISKAESVMIPGDICNVADGTYDQPCSITINTDGASTEWTVFKSTNKWGAKIIIPSSTGDYVEAFGLQNSKYIQIEGFEISVPSKNGAGIAASGIQNSHHHIRAYNNHIYNCGASGIQFQQSDYYDIQWNVVHHCAFTSQWQPSGIGVYEARKSDSEPGYHIIVANNISYSNENKVPRTDGAITDGNGIIIDDFNCSQQTPHTAYDQQTLVENNLCYDNRGRGIYVMSSKNVTFRNNTAYNNSRNLGGGELVCHDASNITWINNIAWAGVYEGRTVSAICDDGAWGVNSNIKWINNLTYNGTEGQNSVYLNKTSTKSIDTTNLLGVNPMLINPQIYESGNFRLQAASPAKDAGTAIFGAADTDIDSTARIQDGLIDLGCYETAGTTVAVTGITISLTSASMAITGWLQLTSNLEPADASYKAVIWSSDNNSVASVTIDGLVTGIALGTADITVTSKDGNKTATCEITVTNDVSVDVSEVKVSPETSIIEVGTKIQIEISVIPTYASNIITWSSDNTDIATVSAKGLVTGVAPGMTNITATSENGIKTAICTLTVKDVSVTGVTVNPTISILSADSTLQIIETITPINAKNKTVTWKSSNINVASVSSSGLVTGITAGKATITATTVDGNKTAKCSITVTSKLAAVYEAEEGTLGIDARIQNATNASNGKVIGNLNTTGSYVQINNVDGGSGGAASFVISYSNGFSDNRSLSLYVNGLRVSQVVFASTGGWNVFNDKTVSISLNAGADNTIKLQRDASDVPAADIDKFTFIFAAASVQLNVIANQKITIYPNPATDGSFNLQLNGFENYKNIAISIIDLQGKLIYSKAFKSTTELRITASNILKSGSYFVKAESENTVAMQKLIVR